MVDVLNNYYNIKKGTAFRMENMIFLYVITEKF